MSGICGCMPYSSLHQPLSCLRHNHIVLNIPTQSGPKAGGGVRLKHLRWRNNGRHRRSNCRSLITSTVRIQRLINLCTIGTNVIRWENENPFYCYKFRIVLKSRTITTPSPLPCLHPCMTVATSIVNFYEPIRLFDPTNTQHKKDAKFDVRLHGVFQISMLFKMSIHGCVVSNPMQWTSQWQNGFRVWMGLEPIIAHPTSPKEWSVFRVSGDMTDLDSFYFQLLKLMRLWRFWCIHGRHGAPRYRIMAWNGQLVTEPRRFIAFYRVDNPTSRVWQICSYVESGFWMICSLGKRPLYSRRRKAVWSPLKYWDEKSL